MKQAATILVLVLCVALLLGRPGLLALRAPLKALADSVYYSLLASRLFSFVHGWRPVRLLSRLEQRRRMHPSSRPLVVRSIEYDLSFFAMLVGYFFKQLSGGRHRSSCAGSVALLATGWLLGENLVRVVVDRPPALPLDTLVTVAPAIFVATLISLDGGRRFPGRGWVWVGTGVTACIAAVRGLGRPAGLSDIALFALAFTGLHVVRPYLFFAALMLLYVLVKDLQLEKATEIYEVGAHHWGWTPAIWFLENLWWILLIPGSRYVFRLALLLPVRVIDAILALADTASRLAFLIQVRCVRSAPRTWAATMRLRAPANLMKVSAKELLADVQPDRRGMEVLVHDRHQLDRT